MYIRKTVHARYSINDVTGVLMCVCVCVFSCVESGVITNKTRRIYNNDKRNQWKTVRLSTRTYTLSARELFIVV